MTVLRREPRNPDGDSPIHQQLLIEAKCIVKRLIAPRGTAVGEPERPYLILPILGQSNAFGMGLPVEPDGLDRPPPAGAPVGHVRGPPKAPRCWRRNPCCTKYLANTSKFGPTFAKQLADDTGRPVLIPGARGDTSATPKNGHTRDPADRKTRVNPGTGGPWRPSTPRWREVLRQ